MDKEKLERLLGGRAESILCVDETGSTNTLLRTMADNGASDGQVVIAAKQTEGRGRLGRSFVSCEGGLYLSYLLRNDFSVPCVTAYAAVAVKRAINDVCKVDCGIKWVNDIILNGKKICGILAQSVYENGKADKIILGIGINVCQDIISCFPEELRGTASSLKVETGVEVDIELLAATVINYLDKISSMRDVYNEYKDSCVTIGKKVRVIRCESERNAVCTGLNEDYSLKVVYEDGTEEDVSSGEVSVRGSNGYV